MQTGDLKALISALLLPPAGPLLLVGLGLLLAGGRRAQQRTVAGKAELAAGPGRTLIDHTAHAFREGGVAQPVEHDLRDRAHARGVIARLVPFCRRKAVEGRRSQT